MCPNMPPSASSRPLKPKASDIAVEVKKYYIPYINTKLPHWPAYSQLHRNPVEELHLKAPSQRNPPVFQVETGDPVDIAFVIAEVETRRLGEEIRTPFLCAAHEHRPGGHWETSASSYEERLCRRSNLAAALSVPYQQGVLSNYPIPCEGGILSRFVTVFRGPRDEDLQVWHNLPVISIPPTSRPKLDTSGRKYSFLEERNLIKTKMRAALLIAVYNGFYSIVIGDFGLGSARNPPHELANLWREVFLFDPDIRGQFTRVAFIFEDTQQNTSKNILDDIAKKNKLSSHRDGSSSKGKANASSHESHSSDHNSPSDISIFKEVFDKDEIHRVLEQPDSRYSLSTIMA